MRERNERYGDDQWGACLEAPLKGKRGRRYVVDHSSNIGLGVYRREEGEETVNTEQTDA